MRVKEKLRYELKYVLTAEQAAAVRVDLASYVAPDEHGDAQGAYRITSLYYDTPDYRAYWDKLEGHEVRRKVRVRTYGDTMADGHEACYLEIKHRVNQRMGKRRARLPYTLATDFAAFTERPSEISDADWAVIREVGYLYATLRLQPACIVRYDRLALNGDASHPDLRITFDTNLPRASAGAEPAGSRATGWRGGSLFPAPRPKHHGDQSQPDCALLVDADPQPASLHPAPCQQILRRAGA